MQKKKNNIQQNYKNQEAQELVALGTSESRGSVKLYTEGLGKYFYEQLGTRCNIQIMYPRNVHWKFT